MDSSQPLPQIRYGVLPPTIPEPWASHYGQDDKGYWMAFELEGIEQRFRWIPPGRFLMGSPESEKERGSDEIQHLVTLSQGYWLAETACTQALWLAVMGNNPSKFNQSAQHPVDSVSWNDCQQFIRQLNQAISGLEARLPTEAEWEFACRAGSITPFSFGETIQPEQVNYDGNRPYVDWKKDLYRESTIPVSKLPANEWGLFEMHGNLLEWCEDGYEEYGNTAQVDPLGKPSSDYRVLRGGSWFNYARSCRSASRIGYRPGFRNNGIGFRLARG